MIRPSPSKRYSLKLLWSVLLKDDLSARAYDAVVGREGIRGVLSEHGGSDGTDGQPDGSRGLGGVPLESDRDGGRASPVGVGSEGRSLGLGERVRRRRSGDRPPRDAPDKLPVVLDDQDRHRHGGAAPRRGRQARPRRPGRRVLPRLQGRVAADSRDRSPASESQLRARQPSADQVGSAR